MKELNRIVAIVNLSAPTQLAARRAEALAAAAGATLHLQGIIHQPEFSGDIFQMAGAVEEGQRAALAGARRRIDEILAELETHSAHTTIDAAWGHPFHTAVIDAVKKQRADLVVMSPHRKNRLTHQEWRLVSRCPVPLLIARLESWRRPPRIFAGVDPAHPDQQPESLDREILAAAQFMARLHGGSFEVVHALGEMSSSSSATQSPTEREADPKRIRGEQIRKLLPADAESVEVQLIAMEPADALCEMAETRDLAVMGALDRARITEWLIGSTARDALAKMGCDVLIVKPPPVAR